MAIRTQPPVEQNKGSTESSHSDRGSMLVEFALVLPVLIMFIMGTITLGLGYNREISMNNSARESARYGATLPVSDDLTGWLNTIADVATDAAAGDMHTGAPGQELCIAYVYPDGTDAHDRTLAVIETAGSRVVVAGATCFDDGRPSGERRVQVSMSRESKVLTGVTTSSMTLDARSVARYERA